MRLAVLALIASAPLSAQTCYVDVHNTAPSSIVAFAAAPSGTGAYRSIRLAAGPLHGGGDTASVAFDASEGRLRDLRTTFADGRTLIVTGFDVCRQRSVRTGAALRAAVREDARLAGSPPAVFLDRRP